MRVTSKGQVTIPREVREELGLLPHTEVEFEVRDGVAYIVKAEGKSGRGNAVVGRLRGKGSVRLSTDQIMALTRGER
jgi:AbrB family looped-hinge helix DNA binding protein